MLPVQPVLSQAALPPPHSDRVDMRMPVTTPKPIKSEITRPVAPAGSTATLYGSPGSGERARIQDSPMRMVMEAMARADSSKKLRSSQSLAPPVPMRYMTALMLQSLNSNSDGVNKRL